jgi:hypothetical protein
MVKLLDHFEAIGFHRKRLRTLESAEPILLLEGLNS